MRILRTLWTSATRRCVRVLEKLACALFYRAIAFGRKVERANRTQVAAGCRPAFKPHMLIPSPDNKLVAISYTGDQFVHLVDAETKAIVACLDATNPAPGVEA